MKCVILKDFLSPWVTHSSLHIPPQPSTCRVILLKGKQKNVQADSFSALRLFIFCTYTEPQSDLPHCSQRYHQIQLSKPPPSLQEFWHANCSHCLVNDTQWGRINWRQTNAIHQKISPRPLPSSAETQRNIVSKPWLGTASCTYSANHSHNAALKTNTLTTATLQTKNVAEQ